MLWGAAKHDSEPCTSGCSDPKPLLLWAPRKAKMYKSFKFDTPPKARRRLVFTQDPELTKASDSDKITNTPQTRKRAYKMEGTSEVENNAKRSHQESETKRETTVITDGRTSEDDCDQS
ncbi:hypothetical protein T01_16121 [Trichinella spiralis]|uniref:Uncharacterized protein n=1 Tax=Trichinella spiralis TaxID=6334 RepID=A0A0V1BRF2_TRISP|nr:hypothetical protein T01_16121 [Trichinella spiralis]